MGSPYARVVAAAAALAAILACAGPAPDPAASIDRGLACVAARYDGNDFADEYLRFVYPGEQLASPLPDRRITYRILDAYFIVLMLRQAGVEPGPARALFADAEATTAALVPAWRAEGIYNLRKNPSAEGIALDTYAILAYLRRDAPMARVILAGLDGGGWLPANLYAGPESFRLLADESWATRALVATGVAPETADSAVRRIAADAVADLARDLEPVARVNLALHALEAIDDLRSVGGAGSRRDGGSLDRVRSDLVAEMERLLDDPKVRGDTLTLANVTATLAIARPETCADLSSSIDLILRRQGEDGCWRLDEGGAGQSGQVFGTLRSILALARYRACRSPASAAGARGTSPPVGGATDRP